MPYLEDLSYVYESIIVESAEARLDYIVNKYTDLFLKAGKDFEGHSAHNIKVSCYLTKDFDFVEDPRQRAKYAKFHLDTDEGMRNSSLLDLFSSILSRDPTQGKYAEWLVRLLYKSMLTKDNDVVVDVYGEIFTYNQEDEYKLPQSITAFDRYKSSLPTDQRDINKFKSIKQFLEVATPLILKSKEEQVKQIYAALSPNEYQTLIKDKAGWTVVVPFTKNAAKGFGGMTKWCTSELRDEWNRFDDYCGGTTHDGDALLIFLKGDKPMYQFYADFAQTNEDHMNDSYVHGGYDEDDIDEDDVAKHYNEILKNEIQFMDVDDHSVDLEKSIPYPVLEALTKVKTNNVNINHAIWVIDKIISV